MPAQIRKTQKSDIELISVLYQGRKSIEELDWIFRDPEKEDEYNSFVAADGNEIIGVIGYTLSWYIYGEKRYRGVMYFNWLVSDNHRGIIGVRLLQEAFKLGDFGFGMNTTKIGLSVYRIAKLEYIADMHILVKLLRPVGYMSSLEKSFAKKMLKTIYYLPGLVHPPEDADPSVTFEEFSDQIIMDHGSREVFRMEENRAKIKWLLQCPLVDAFCFIIAKDKVEIGIVILYIKKETRRGEIIYVSYFEDPSVWNAVIHFAMQFFNSRKCVAVAMLANNPVLVRLLTKHGFMDDNHKYPWFVKDPAGILSDIPLSSWHCTFAESDRAISFLNF